MKDLYNLRKQAQEMEKRLAAESITGTSGDSSVSVTINGKHEVLSVKIADDIALEKESLEKAFKQAYSDAQSKLQKVLVEKFRDLM